MKTISLIAAMGHNRIIGNQGKIPWNLPEDLKFFKRITMGRPIIMGRKTYESIGRVLPGRINIIITSHEKYTQAPDAIIARTLEEAFAFAPEGEIFVIGGERVYCEALLAANRLYLTFVDGDFSGDAFFPAFDLDDWKEISRESFPLMERVIFERR
ncbi:MAG: dihydrofolate reductase [Parcubacteria group bacterium]|nr:dihydrofolate reductase [Parcubacteria group bacterium]